MSASAPRTKQAVASLPHPLDSPPEGAPGNLPGLLDALLSPILRPAAVLVPLIARAEGTQLLFTVRSEALTHHGGQISFPGGRLEAGESVVVAALREAMEEIGARPEHIEAFGYLDPVATISGFRVTPVLAWLSEAAELQADASEVSEIFEVPLAQLLAPGSRGERSVLWRGIERRTSAYRHLTHQIWGVTAQILDQLLALPDAVFTRSARWSR